MLEAPVTNKEETSKIVKYWYLGANRWMHENILGTNTTELCFKKKDKKKESFDKFNKSVLEWLKEDLASIKP